MNKRTVTGIVIGAVIAFLAIAQGWYLRAAVFALMIVSVWECLDALAKKGMRPVKWVSLGFAALAMPAFLLWGAGALLPLAAAFLCAGLTCVVLTGDPDMPRAGATVFPILYPGLLFALLLPLTHLGNRAHTLLALAMLFAIPLFSDVAAFAVGSRWGKRKLCPRISPKKTVEGAVAGLCASVLSAVLLAFLAHWLSGSVPYLRGLVVRPLWQFALLGLFGGALSQLGDLSASMLKRYCGVKDFGSIFPGHGGMLDRFDSVLFAVLAVYVYFAVLGA